LVLVEDDATPYTGVNSGEVQGAGESLDTDDGCTSYTQQVLKQLRVRLLLLCVVLALLKKSLAEKYDAIGVIINNVADAGPVNGGGENM
jgi:hypothetical protein